MRNLATIGLCLFLWDTRLWSEPISVGLAMEDTVVVSADSSVTSPRVAALPFAHHVLVLGEGDGITSTFDRNGWTQVETVDRLKGWVRSKAIAVAAKLRRRWSAGDTLYEAPGHESPPHLPKYRRHLQDVRLRQILGDETWLGVYERESRSILWIPAEDYQHEDVYIALSKGYGGLHYDVAILPLHPEEYREGPLGGGPGREIPRNPLKALQVALRLQEIVLPQDTLFSYGVSIHPSNAGAFAADLVHEAYLGTVQYEEAVEALKSIVQGEPTDLLMGHPAAPVAALEIGAIYSSYLQDELLSKGVEKEKRRPYPS